MFKKNDPLVASVQAVLEQGARNRQIEQLLNESIGIDSKKALPHEFHADYDAILSEAQAAGDINEALKDKIKSIGKKLYNELPSRRAKIADANARAAQGKTPKDWARRQAAVNSAVNEEEQLDEAKKKDNIETRVVKKVVHSVEYKDKFGRWIHHSTYNSPEEANKTGVRRARRDAKSNNNADWSDYHEQGRDADRFGPDSHG